MEPRLRPFLAPALLVLTLAGVPATVTGAPLAPGTRVRVTVLERVPAESLFVGERPLAGGPFIGSVLARQTDVLVLEPEDSTGTRLILRRPAIAALEISRGRHSRAGRGALIGLLAGGVGGALFGAHILGTEREAQGFEPVVFGIGGLFVGGGLGAIVGSLIHVEDWRSATPDEAFAD